MIVPVSDRARSVDRRSPIIMCIIGQVDQLFTTTSRLKTGRWQKSKSTNYYTYESHRAGGGRTHTVSPPTDFKSVASAYSATAPCVQYFTIIPVFLNHDFAQVRIDTTIFAKTLVPSFGAAHTDHNRK